MQTNTKYSTMPHQPKPVVKQGNWLEQQGFPSQSPTGGSSSPSQQSIGTPQTAYRQTDQRDMYQSPMGYGSSSYSTRPQSYNSRGSGGYNGQSSIGGISAVNPQSDLNVQGYVDQTYDALSNRLNPVFEQQQASFDQGMTNRGIPVGSEAYNKALAQMDQNKSDAYTQAGMQALGFGADLQNQNFSQDATRSSLANALLQSKWNNDASYAGLAEQGRQFDQGLGQRNYEFDTGMDYNYWGDQAKYDYLYNQADRNDMRWLNEFGRNVTNDQNSNNRWADSYGLNYTQPYNPNTPNVGGAFVGAQQANNNTYQNNYDGNSNWWNSLGQTVGNIATEIPWGKKTEPVKPPPSGNSGGWHG